MNYTWREKCKNFPRYCSVILNRVEKDRAERNSHQKTLPWSPHRSAFSRWNRAEGSSSLSRILSCRMNSSLMEVCASDLIVLVDLGNKIYVMSEVGWSRKDGIFYWSALIPTDHIRWAVQGPCGLRSLECWCRWPELLHVCLLIFRGIRG
jgi:hypothetical protein